MSGSSKKSCFQPRQAIRRRMLRAITLCFLASGLPVPAFANYVLNDIWLDDQSAITGTMTIIVGLEIINYGIELAGNRGSFIPDSTEFSVIRTSDPDVGSLLTLSFGKSTRVVNPLIQSFEVSESLTLTFVEKDPGQSFPRAPAPGYEDAYQRRFTPLSGTGEAIGATLVTTNTVLPGGELRYVGLDLPDIPFDNPLDLPLIPEVPVPTSSFLLLTGLGGLLIWKRKA